MKKIANLVKERKGYVGIEVIVIAGMIIGLGLISISIFSSTSSKVTQENLTKIDNSVEDMHINTNFNN